MRAYQRTSSAGRGPGCCPGAMINTGTRRRESESRPRPGRRIGMPSEDHQLDVVDPDDWAELKSMSPEEQRRYGAKEQD